LGAEIHIRLTSDRHNNKNLAPFLGRDFQYEISEGSIWQNKRSFLNSDEIKLLKATYDELFENKDLIPTIEPKSLKEVLVKVKNYLRLNQSELPFEIEIDYEKMEKENLNYYLTVNESRCWIKDDSKYNNVFNKVQIVNYKMELNKVDIWIDISDKVEIEGKIYYLKKTTRYEKYADLIDKVIDFCRHAEDIKNKIYWIYTH